MNPTEAIQRGRQAMIFFHNRASKYSGYSLTIDQLIATLGTEKQVPIYLANFGDYIIENEMSESGVRAAMENLADAGQGKVPHQTSIFNALGGQVAAINWLDLTKTVAVETAKQVAQGAQAVGETVIATASSLNTLLPILVVGAVIFIVVMRSKQAAGA